MSDKTQQKREQKKQAMIANFIKVFCEQGLDGTYMRRLALSTGVSEALLYRYFENKDDIIRQCVVRYHEQIQQELTEVISAYLHQPKQMPEKVLDYVDSVIDICRFLLQVMAHPTYCSIMEETLPSVNGHILSIAALLQARLAVPSDTATGVAFLLNSMVNEYILKKSRESFLRQFGAVALLIWERS